MPYFTLQDGKTVCMSHAELRDYENETGICAEIYHSGYPQLFKVTFSDGTVGEFTRRGARRYSAINKVAIESGLPPQMNHKDLYKGYNPALGMHISGKSEYNKVLKARGLIEVGNEREAFDKIAPSNNYSFSREDVKEIINQGADLSDGQADALVEGKL